MQRNSISDANRIYLFFDRLIKKPAHNPVTIPITNGSRIIPTMASGEAALRSAHNGNNREENDHADDIIDGRKGNQGFGNGTLCTVFLDDREQAPERWQAQCRQK